MENDEQEMKTVKDHSGVHPVPLNLDTFQLPYKNVAPALEKLMADMRTIGQREQEMKTVKERTHSTFIIKELGWSLRFPKPNLNLRPKKE